MPGWSSATPWPTRRSPSPTTPAARPATTSTARSRAYCEADIINTHALDATGGKTYAELERDDPTRETAMQASFLQASLFTSVVAFGVALMGVAVGLVLVLIGFALRTAPAAAPIATAPRAEST